MRRAAILRDDSGQTVVLVAILLVVLFGFTALAVDVARMYAERRELQRTADLSALAGARELAPPATSDGPAQQMAECYLGENPANTACTSGNPTTHHPGPYNALTGDIVNAYMHNVDPPGTHPPSCEIDGVVYDCVYSKAVAPAKSADPNGFEFLFAKVLGFDERSISAEATALLGAGAPGGGKLVPWLLRDCPRKDLANDPEYPQYAGEDDPVVVAYAETDPLTEWGCPYVFSADYNDETKYVNLFGGVGSGGNYQGASFLADNPDCPPPDGYFQAPAGTDLFTEILAATTTSCDMWVGARVHTKPGQPTIPTAKALTDRGVASCIENEAEFNSAITVVDPATAQVRINHMNPCMVAVLLSVHTESCPEPAGLKDKTTKGVVLTMQEDIFPTEGGASCKDISALSLKERLDYGRFRPFDQGTSQVMIVRRVALFYLVKMATGAQDEFEGLFLRAVDSQDSKLAPARCDAEAAICVVKLVA